jgi:hypothetical protein
VLENYGNCCVLLLFLLVVVAGLAVVAACPCPDLHFCSTIKPLDYIFVVASHFDFPFASLEHMYFYGTYVHYVAMRRQKMEILLIALAVYSTYIVPEL